MKGAGNAPHDLLHTYMSCRAYSMDVSGDMDPLVEVQRSDVVHSLRDKGMLRSCVTLVDV